MEFKITNGKQLSDRQMLQEAIKIYLNQPASVCLALLAGGFTAAAVLLTPPGPHQLLIAIPTLLSPFIEWGFHKYILHMPVNEPGPLRDYMDRMHFKHHEDPNNPDLINAPVSALLIGTLLLAVVCFALMPAPMAVSLMAGITLYYVVFEFIHLAHHIPGYRPITKLGEKMRKLHNLHHHKDENKWWGITSHLADIVFRTNPDPQTVRKSATVYDIHPLRKGENQSKQVKQPTG